MGKDKNTIQQTGFTDLFGRDIKLSKAVVGFGRKFEGLSRKGIIMDKRQKDLQEIQKAVGRFSTEMYSRMVKAYDSGRRDWKIKKNKDKFFRALAVNVIERKCVNIACYAMILDGLDKK